MAFPPRVLVIASNFDTAALTTGVVQALEGIAETLFVPENGQRRLAENAVGTEKSHQKGQEDRAY